MAQADQESFGDLLRYLRDKAGLTQEGLAEAAQLSARAVSDLERGINQTARQDTAALLADALALDEPVRGLFVAAARGRGSVASVLTALSARPSNLPAPVDSFVGRQAELAEITAAISAHRLVTLTGAGGSGKTRLALEAAAGLLPDFGDGVWLVQLAPITGEERILEAIAQSLTIPDHSEEAVGDTIERWLRERDLLLILDNCEHVLPSVRAFCERVLPACNRLRIMSTSREFLDVRGEHAIVTPPLAVPDEQSPPGDRQSDALQLFLERAVAAAPAFRAGDADLDVVADICRRLDGLPLAIELAAARLRALSLKQLSARLEDQFWQLTDGNRHRLPGQRTLEAVVGWSYHLLTGAERRVFARLSVFPHHFTLEIAEAVVSDPPVGPADVVDILAGLVGKSLVATVNAPDGLRYQLLEMLRQYGHDRLAESGEVDRCRERLFCWAIAGVTQLESVIRTAAMDDALRQATTDALTYRSAMQWADAHGHHGGALRIASMVPLSSRWEERRAEILRRLDQAGEAGQLDDASAGHAWAAITNIAFEQNDWQAAIRAGDRAIESFRAAQLTRLAAWSQYLKLHSAWGAGQLAEVDRLVTEVVALFRQESDEMGLGYSLWVAALRSSDPLAAKEMAAEADALLRRAGNASGIAHAVEGRGIIAFERGELPEAARCITETIEILASYGNLGCTAHALEAAAVVVGATGPDGRATAAELLAAAAELRHRSGQGHAPWEIRARLGAALDERLGAADAAAASSSQAAGAKPRYSLAVASALGTEALGSLLGSADR